MELKSKEEVASHLKACEFASKCEYCDDFVVNSEMSAHKRQCMHYKYKCKDCGKELKRAHNPDLSLMYACLYCGKTICKGCEKKCDLCYSGGCEQCHTICDEQKKKNPKITYNALYYAYLN